MASSVNLQKVLDSGMCIACGACAAADPTLRLTFDADRGMFRPDGAGNAAAACPAIEVDFAGLQRDIFGGATIGPHGVVEQVYLAQSRDHERNLRASSGGMIKELILHYLDSPEVDGVICLHEISGLRYEPRLLTRGQDVSKLPGSIYHNIPFDNALRILREREGKFVLVAIPCQLEGIYKFIYGQQPELAKKLHATIGLICGWNYSHHAIKAVCQFKGIDFDRIEKISYRGGGPVGKLRIRTDRGEHAINRRVDFGYQVAFDRSFNIPRCHVCINHCNFLADIVVGDAWLPSTVGTTTGISVVICRKASAVAAMQRLAADGKIVMTGATEEEITESQSRRITFGEFAYAYADYLRSQGLHCPDMTGPNRADARLVSPSAVQKFHRNNETKMGLQRQERYRRLWWRKATVELRPFLGRYVRWFLVRILKIKSLLGTRAEVPKEQLADFR